MYREHYPHLRGKYERSEVLRWGLPAGLLVALAGYFGAWIWHFDAGLVILGIDLAEYVKFLPEVRAGALSMWREWFILPAGALSISLTLVAANRRLAIRWYIALFMLMTSIFATLSMLPPVWTPALLMTLEFQKQTILLVICLAMIPLSLLFRGIRPHVLAWLVTIAQAVVAIGAIRQFILAKPAIDQVYGTPPLFGWGVFTYTAGVALITLVTLIAALRSRAGQQF